MYWILKIGIHHAKRWLWGKWVEARFAQGARRASGREMPMLGTCLYGSMRASTFGDVHLGALFEARLDVT